MLAGLADGVQKPILFLSKRCPDSIKLAPVKISEICLLVLVEVLQVLSQGARIGKIVHMNERRTRDEVLVVSPRGPQGHWNRPESQRRGELLGDVISVNRALERKVELAASDGGQVSFALRFIGGNVEEVHLDVLQEIHVDFVGLRGILGHFLRVHDPANQTLLWRRRETFFRVFSGGDFPADLDVCVFSVSQGQIEKRFYTWDLASVTRGVRVEPDPPLDSGPGRGQVGQVFLYCFVIYQNAVRCAG